MTQKPAPQEKACAPNIFIFASAVKSLRRHFFYLLMPILVLSAASCNSQQAPTPKEEVRDTTITQTNAYSDLFLDSAQVANYMARQPWHDSLKAALRSFYNSRNYQYA